MIPFNLTALTRAIPFIQRKAKAHEIFRTKTLKYFTQLSFIVSIFNQISCFILNLLSSTTELRHFKRKALAELISQFTIDEGQEREAQPIYLSSDESENASPCSSSIPQLPNDVPDTYTAITQRITAEHDKCHLPATLPYNIQAPRQLR